MATTIPAGITRGGSELWIFKEGSFEQLDRQRMPQEVNWAGLFEVGDRARGIWYSVAEYVHASSKPPFVMRFHVHVTLLHADSPNTSTIIVPTFVDLLLLLGILEPLTRHRLQ